MKFIPTPLDGAYLIDMNKKEDDRGFFARAFCSNEFKELDLDAGIVQINNSLSRDKGTLRGMHYQLAPMAETKIVRCIQGSLFDVILDIREGSATFGGSFGHTLSASNRTMMYVPKGFAHGFITLEDNTEAFYLTTQFYSPENERGIRYNDPAFSIDWPFEPIIISEKDKNLPNY